MTASTVCPVALERVDHNTLRVKLMRRVPTGARSITGSDHVGKREANL